MERIKRRNDEIIEKHGKDTEYTKALAPVLIILDDVASDARIHDDEVFQMLGLSCLFHDLTLSSDGGETPLSLCDHDSSRSQGYWSQG